MDLTDAQWEYISALIPDPPRRDDGKGRPWRPARDVLNGVLWILRTGAPWKDLPERYPPYQTVHRRFQHWVRSGTLEVVLKALAEDLRDRGDIDLSECYIDGTFIVAKKGGRVLAPPSGARARSSWQWQTLLALSSPLTLSLLRRMKSDLLHQLSKLDSSRNFPND
ncbi:MAG: family transposase, orfA [Chlorobi bacterium]|nr:family transposase, orfA [Chlorobiota bacterium]